MRRRSWLWRRIALLVAVVALAAACAGDDAGNNGARIRLEDFRFVPNRIALDAGDEIAIELENAGAVGHDWTLLRRSVTSEAQITDDLIIQRVVVAAGGSTTVTLAGLEPGGYQYVCAIPGHFTLGMSGMLELTGSREP